MNRKTILALIAAAAIFTLIVISVYIVNFFGTKISSSPSDWGVFGDYLGGVLNPVFAFLSLIALLITMIYQLDSSKRIERAYVFIKMEISNPINSLPNVINTVNLTLENHGKTPAILKCLIGHGFEGSKDSFPNSFDKRNPDIYPIPIGVIIPPGGIYKEAFINFKFSRVEQFERIYNKTEIFGFIGKIEYEDIFGDHRETGYCWNIEIIGPKERICSMNISPSKGNYYK